MVNSQSNLVYRVIRWIAEKVLVALLRWASSETWDQPFQDWLLRTVGQAYLKPEGFGWGPFREYILARLEPNGADRPLGTLALCGNKNCSNGQKDQYYEMFFRFADRPAFQKEMFVCRVFIRPCCFRIWKRLRVRRDIDRHREKPGIFAMVIERADLKQIKNTYPSLVRQLMLGFGIVILCHPGENYTLIMHEGIGRAAFYVLKSGGSGFEGTLIREVLKLYMQVLKFSSERDDRSTQEVVRAVKTLLPSP